MRSLEAGGKHYTEEIVALRARVAELECVNRRLTKSSGADEDLDKAWTEWERTFDAARDSILVFDGDIDRVIHVIRDVTEHKWAEARVTKQLEELHRWQVVILGREDRNMKLKREVNELLRRMGEPIYYPSQTGAKNHET